MKPILSLRAAVLGATIVTSAGLFAQTPSVPLPGVAIPKYVTPLPHFAGARVDGTKPLTIGMVEFQQKVLPDAFYAALAAPYSAGTYVWGYEVHDGTTAHGPNYPAFTIETQRGTKTTVKYENRLTSPVLQQRGYLIVDQTLHWADPRMQHGSMQPYLGPVPAVTHLHGGEVESRFDGGPDAWVTPWDHNNQRLEGPAWELATNLMSDTYEYPNAQEGATLWYHDHALGVTRLNVYGGLAGFYLLRDPSTLDTGKYAPGGLPAGDYEIEIAIQDRIFDINGQLHFPSAPALNPEHPFWQPEFLGDVIVVNGRTWPYLEVEPRRYRFRFLDGSNARFYRMWLENMATATPGPVFWQIGTDGGLLDRPVKIDPADPLNPMFLVMAPGERCDLVIDFSAFAGQTLTLRNNARSPFPFGATADPQTVGQIMQFRVTKPLSGADNSLDPATAPALRGPGRLIPRLTNGGAVAVTPDVTRLLTLNEVMGMPQVVGNVAYPGGPLEVLVNNTKWDGAMSKNIKLSDFPDGVTEVPTKGSTELWEIVNLTADAHPIHLHLVQFQLVNRQKFNVNRYTKVYAGAFPGGMVHNMTYPPGVFMPAFGPPLDYLTGTPGKLGGNPDVAPYLQGPAKPPLPNEVGWKDTVIMYPGEVSRIVVRLAPTDQPLNSTTKGINYFPFEPTTGPGYVWHCHIIDHEDNEMMRPMKVK